MRTPPTTVNANFDGVNQDNSNCNCQPPDVNAAVGISEIAQTVNLRLQVFDKSGNTLCGIDLNTFLGTTGRLSDPRVQYDNVYDRFSMVVTVVPGSGATPSMFLAASQSGDACGSWFVYNLTFGGSMFPPGTLLDYPYLGQDNQPGVAGSTFNGAILSSTNNFCCAPFFSSYIGSASFAIPKDAAYQGLALSFPTFSVATSTAPSTTAGIPTFSTTTTYFVAAVPGTGYDLYAMTSSPDPSNVSMTLQAVISAPFNPPSRRVQQPGTSQTLDPLDGRIVWAPVQDGQFVWFAHGIDLAGFPSVRYGAIDVVNNIAITASAYHSTTSDDFNPSIGVTDDGSGNNYIWVNWAWTDTPNAVPTTDTIDGVLPGGGVPNLIGTDLPLITGFSTSSNFRFGDFSSVAADPVAASPTCPAGLTAVTAQQYFTSNGHWATSIASSSFC
jgi:hypothetical protein